MTAKNMAGGVRGAGRRLLSPSLLHGQDLDHTDEDVNKVQLEPNGLVDWVPSHQTSLTHPGVVQDLLHIIKSEASKDGQTTIEPDVLSEHEGPCSSGGQNQGSETGESDDGDAGEQRTTKVEILFLLGGGTDKGDGAHHADSVETGAGEDCWGEEKHG